MESKKVDSVEAKSRMVVRRGGVGMGRCWRREQSCSYIG